MTPMSTQRPATNLLQVRVVMKAVGSMTCDMAVWLVDDGVAVMLT